MRKNTTFWATEVNSQEFLEYKTNVNDYTEHLEQTDQVI